MADAKDIVHAKSYTPRKGAIRANYFNPHSIAVLWAQVLIERESENKKTDGGIFKPDIALEPQFTGIVVAKGPDCTNEAIKPGSRIMFSKYAGAEIEVGEGDVIKTYALMHESDVLAIIPHTVRARRVD